MPNGLAGISVLVVEDDPDSREVLVYLLEHAGALVCAVDSAEAARRVLDAQEPDVLVSDIAMPDEDGYSLIRSVRARAPAPASRIHAIALTAFATAADRARALNAGFDLHLTKPALPRKLFAAIRWRRHSSP